MILAAIPLTLLAQPHEESFSHPIKTGETYTKTDHCPNCGMNINMWARTRHQFHIGPVAYETCSIRCMVDIAEKAGVNPSEVKAAVYFEPQIMAQADQGWYVIGSKAAGTMTMKSKIFFSTREKADAFAARHGGEVIQLKQAMAAARKELQPMRGKLQQKRLKKGKISVPDAQVSCGNCGMHPAKYPQFRSQMNGKGIETIHFCSTKCLIQKKATLTGKGRSAWVTVYPDGDTEFAEGLYYVIGSDVMGPMGPDALPFRKRHDAVEFTTSHGGEIKTYQELKPSLFGEMMHHMM
jgi:nitrous oxide reductase accessory protein NosL